MIVKPFALSLSKGYDGSTGSPRTTSFYCALALYQWIDTIAMHFPSLSKPEALGLALWSFGMVVARSCSLTAVADVLSPLLGQKYNTLRERLRRLPGWSGPVLSSLKAVFF
ncbi:hypothetical protein [Methylovulum psychrotolerans]|uniref:hypothetical protein n=1 Tax=Methylovulum psychrotolerans TaxID=1704499 RepID=UPI0018DF81AB|nr:hypothetical protein [Methylovulum psychrotolerans]